MNYLGDFRAGSTVYVPFNTFDASGASVTISGLAVTGIEVYKNGSTTQRASDNGYALLDTDGIDFDGTTGLHGFSIDTSDNSDAGFYAAGNDYWIAVTGLTVDGQTVNFWAAIFSIQNRSALTAAEVNAEADTALAETTFLNRVADHVLRRSWASAAASSDGDAKSFRSLLGAVAKLVNRVTVSGSTLSVYEADDSTTLGTQTVSTDAAAEPITQADTD